jgi:hypothetical protein
MNERHGGLLGALSEALEIQQTEGVSPDEAFAIQRERAAERLKEYELERGEVPETNVVYGIDFTKGRR